jgi:hypothetical protein
MGSKPVRILIGAAALLAACIAIVLLRHAPEPRVGDEAYLYCPRMQPGLLDAFEEDIRSLAGDSAAGAAGTDEIIQHLRNPRGRDLSCPVAGDKATARDLAAALKTNDRAQILHVFQSHPGAIGLESKGAKVAVLPDDPAVPECRHVREVLSPRLAAYARQTDVWVMREYVVSWDPNRR